MASLASEVTFGTSLRAHDASSEHRDSSLGVRSVHESGSLTFAGPFFLVYNVCQFSHATFSVVRDPPNLNTLYTRVYWDMGDGNNYDYTIPSLNPLPVNDAWMTVLHRYQLPGRYNVKMRLYLDNNQSILYSRDVDIMPKPAIPVAPDTIDYCVGSSATPLSATAGPNNTLTWYTAKLPPATGWNISPTEPLPTTSSEGTQAYQVTQTIPEGCVSDPKTIIVKVSSAPIDASLSVVSPNYCEDAVAQPLATSVTGMTYRTVLRWYQTNNPAEPPLPSAPIPGTDATSLPGRSYFVSLYSTIGCGESSRKEVPVRVFPRPTAPASAAVNLCLNQPSPLLPTVTQSTGHTLRWYGTNATGGGYTFTPPEPSVSSIGTANYYVSQHFQYTSPSIGCESRRTALVVTVHDNPRATMSGDAIVCQDAPSTRITFQGSGGNLPYTFKYILNNGVAQTATTLNGSSSREVDVPNGAGGMLKYDLIAVSDVYGCTRTLAATSTVRVLATPDAGISGPAEACAASSSSLTITGSQGTAPYTFTYQRDNGPMESVVSAGSLSTANVSLSTAQPGTQTITLQKVSYAVGGTTCEKTLARVHTITINPSPVLPTVTGAAFCQGTTGISLPTVTPIAGTTLRWYGTSATGGSWSATPPVPPTGTVGLSNYYVSQFNPTTGCEGQRAEIPVRIHPLPEAVLGQGAIVCQSSPDPQLTLTGSRGTSPYTFYYRINGGATRNAVTSAGTSVESLGVSTAAPLTASYELLEVADANGCRQAQSGTSVFRVLATPDAVISAPTDLCRGATASTTFTATSGKAPYTFTYSINGGAEQTVVSPSGTNTARADIPSSGAGTMTFRLTKVSYSDGTTCSKGILQDLNVTVHPLPLANVGIVGIVGQTASSLLLCQGSASPGLRFTGTVGAEPYSFSYTMNGAAQTATSTGPSITLPISTNAAGTFRYELGQVTDARGCVSNLTGLSTTVRILTNPVATLKGAAKVCEKDAEPVLTFKGTQGSAPYRFTYTLNGGPDLVVLSPAGADSTTLRAPTSVPGTYTYRLKEVSYTDGITCVSSLSEEAMVMVYDLPIGSMKGSSTDIEICQLQPFPEILFSGRGGTPPYTFRYRRNNEVLTSTGNSFIEKASTRTAGTTLYELLEIQDARLCRQAQAGKVKVTVHPIPVVDAGPDKIMLENSGITLDGSASNGNGLRFQWTPSTNLSDPTAPKPLATPPQSTRYLLTVTSDKGCSDTSSMLLQVLFKPVIPNTFTPNGDGYNDRWEILNLGAYPDAIVEIYNDRGHLLMRNAGQYRPWDGTYKGMPLPVGTYYYVIHPRSGRDKVAGYVTILR